MKKLLILALTSLVGCTSVTWVSQPGGSHLLVVTEEQFTLGSPEDIAQPEQIIVEINPPESIRNGISHFIPKHKPERYDYLRDYARDVEQAIKSAKTAGESIEGLNIFFGKTLPNDQQARKTLFLPRLILRCRDKSGKKVWVIHMNWEYYMLPMITNAESEIIVVSHTVTYVVDYETGKIIREQGCI